MLADALTAARLIASMPRLCSFRSIFGAIAREALTARRFAVAPTDILERRGAAVIFFIVVGHGLRLSEPSGNTTAKCAGSAPASGREVWRPCRLRHPLPLASIPW